MHVTLAKGDGTLIHVVPKQRLGGTGWELEPRSLNSPPPSPWDNNTRAPRWTRCSPSGPRWSACSGRPMWASAPRASSSRSDTGARSASGRDALYLCSSSRLSWAADSGSGHRGCGMAASSASSASQTHRDELRNNTRA